MYLFSTWIAPQNPNLLCLLTFSPALCNIFCVVPFLVFLVLLNITVYLLLIDFSNNSRHLAWIPWQDTWHLSQVRSTHLAFWSSISTACWLDRTKSGECDIVCWLDRIKSGECDIVCWLDRTKSGECDIVCWLDRTKSGECDIVCWLDRTKSGECHIVQWLDRIKSGDSIYYRWIDIYIKLCHTEKMYAINPC